MSAMVYYLDSIEYEIPHRRRQCCPALFRTVCYHRPVGSYYGNQRDILQGQAISQDMDMLWVGKLTLSTTGPLALSMWRADCDRIVQDALHR
jgi:hypothetical protein